LREYPLAQVQDLYEIVKGRYCRGSLILTSNREPLEASVRAISDVRSAEGLLDRLLNSAT
jgi:hypothetical protein